MSSGHTNHSGHNRHHNNRFFQRNRKIDENQRDNLISQIQKNVLSCAICQDKVKKFHKIWSCANFCFQIFHLACIQKWSATSAKNEGGDKWRCPTCQSLIEEIGVATALRYFCFCGKLEHPKSTPDDLPHSCGQLCHKNRGCAHECNLICHPGPCPQCFVQVMVKCDCGRESFKISCSAAKNVNHSCGKPCDKMLDCGQHRCVKTCHPGEECTPCDVEVKTACDCGKHSEAFACPGKPSFQCWERCGKQISCGNHSCDVLCHSGPCSPCDKSVDRVTTCACGKMAIDDMKNAISRKSCLDPIPTCSQKCDKLLQCGAHNCPSSCHSGPCAHCSREVEVFCGCGKSSQKMVCGSPESKNYRCRFACNRKMCSRHKCDTICCRLPVGDHVCGVVCGRLLSCKKHRCEEICHKDSCAPCFEASFEELKCHCGSESLEPPIRCGTRPPLCQKACTRPQPCSHAPQHTCHPDDIECEPCKVLVPKTCIGGHDKRISTACSDTQPVCGQLCGKKLLCGVHTCKLPCHPDGKCEPTCNNKCLKLRTDCFHLCQTLCHVGRPCPNEDCQFILDIACVCGRITKKIKCFQFIQIFGKRPSDQFSAENLKKSLLNYNADDDTRLPCDEVCKIESRNRRLAEAFGIETANVSCKPALTNEYPQELIHFMNNTATPGQKKHLLQIEDILLQMVAECQNNILGSSMGQMNALSRDERKMAYLLAETFNIEASSEGNNVNRKKMLFSAHRSKATVSSRKLADQCTASVPLKTQSSIQPTTSLGDAWLATSATDNENQSMHDNPGTKETNPKMSKKHSKRFVTSKPKSEQPLPFKIEISNSYEEMLD